MTIVQRENRVLIDTDRVTVLGVRRLSTLVLGTRSIATVDAVKGGGDATLTVGQFVALQVLLGLSWTTLLWTGQVVLLVRTGQVTTRDVTTSNAFTGR